MRHGVTTTERERPRRTSEAITLSVVCAAQFMVVLDISVVNVALPSIKDSRFR